jgi:hypothetical protein
MTRGANLIPESRVALTPEQRKILRQTWHHMRQRCSNPASRGYRYYGAKGVTVCERWLTFENFIADMGPRPPKHSIDRIDPAGNYEPSNCRWATAVQQRWNITSYRPAGQSAFGRVQTLQEWATECGLAYSTLATRVLVTGMSLEDALTVKRIRKGPKAGREKGEHTCPECGHTLPTLHGLRCHVAQKHGVRGDFARVTARGTYLDKS